MRDVRNDLIEDWINRHAPMGLEKLAIESEVSVDVIRKLKRDKDPVLPKKVSTLVKIANVICRDIDELFPTNHTQGTAS